MYRGRPILYGCGDLLDDYEGISGYEEFRTDLRLIYLLQVDPSCGRLLELRVVPVRARRFRLNDASQPDAKWLCNLLDTLGSPSAILEAEQR